jgi:hypothetical protein
MARRKQARKDLTGIRQRECRYQMRLRWVRPGDRKQVMLTGSTEDEDAATKLRDKFRWQVASVTSESAATS